MQTSFACADKNKKMRNAHLGVSFARNSRSPNTVFGKCRLSLNFYEIIFSLEANRNQAKTE